METSLHRQLKAIYAGEERANEVRLAGFRIDAVANGELIEVQLGSLAAIRNKIATLLKAKHTVRIVKPIIVRKQVTMLTDAGGTIVHSRKSPKQETLAELFHELVYFTKVFPHKRLILEVPQVSIEETRYPGHGKRRRWRKNDFVIADQSLVELFDGETLCTAADLLKLLPGKPPREFHTGILAEKLGLRRWVAQRVAYCLRECGAAVEIGKAGNARLYRLKPARRRRAA